MTDVDIKGVKKLSPDRGKCPLKLDVKHSKLAAQEKLRHSIKGLEESLLKTKEAFSYFQTKSFFYPEPEFSKAFSQSLQQVENGLTDMGSRLSKLMCDSEKGEKGEQKQRKSLTKEDQVDTSLNLSTDQSAILAKPNLNITPPASEAGNDDELTAVTQLPAETFGRKRNVEVTSQVAKKPRRSLLDDYLIREQDRKEKTLANGEESKTTSSPNEEILYEVENIITYKKHGPKFLYKVSWKGYGMEDCTWEPSEHLENCSEVLNEFYKRLLAEREKVVDSAECFSESFPIDKELQKYLYEAFFTHLQNISNGDSNLLTSSLAKKNNIQRRNV